jgi:chitin disaccharide deacetylase
MEIPRSNFVRRVVFHADDLGINSAVDDGILDAFTNGVLTSTSVLANGPSAENAIKRVLSLIATECTGGRPDRVRRLLLDDPNTSFDLGIHLNLTQGRPLTGDRYPSELLDTQGCFTSPGKLFRTLLRSGKRLAPALNAELGEQIVWALDHGVRPTHANAHQYIDLIPEVSNVVTHLLKRFSIGVVRLPIECRLRATTLSGRGLSVWTLAHIKRTFAVRFARHVAAAQLKHPDGFFGTAHAGRITIAALARRLTASTNECLLEIGMHPGHLADESSPERSAGGWHDPLATLRPSEYELLCSDALVELLVKQELRLGRLCTLNSR